MLAKRTLYSVSTYFGSRHLPSQSYGMVLRKMKQQHAPKLDREYAQVLASLGETGVPPPSLPIGDILGRRQRFTTRIQTSLSLAPPPPPNIIQKTHKISTKDNTTLTLSEFRPKNNTPTTNPTPAIYHIHGGGMILGSVAAFTPTLSARAESYGLPIFSIDYRLAPEHPHPVPVNDCYAGLGWLYANASELGIDSSRIMVQGESAGGGLAAGIAIMARDRKLSPPVAYQMLIYPMLDDRNLEPRPGVEAFTKWRSVDSRTGWGALLGDAAGREEEFDGHEYAAPARVRSVEGLPPTYIDVGGLDYFAEESVDYAARLLEVGIEVELHVYPGLPHDFEWIGAGARIVKSALDNRQHVIEEFKL
jgi:acetyl esterase/lipase